MLLQRDGAARGAVYVGQKVENRGLTGAVRADQSDDLAVLHLNVELIQRLQTGEIDEFNIARTAPVRPRFSTF